MNHLRDRFQVVVVVLLFLSGCSSPPPSPRWEYTGGPSAQNISAVVIDERTPTTVFAGLTTGEVFTTTDQGASWSPVSTVHPLQMIHQLVQNSERSDEFFAATDAGLYRSTNACREWIQVPITALDVVISCQSLAIDPFDSRFMYAGIRGKGIYTTIDAGVTWQLGTTGLAPDRMPDADIHDIRISNKSPNIVYAALSKVGMIRSTDRGITWQALTEDLAESGTVPTCLVLESAEVVCFGTAAGDVYKSINGGRGWSPTRQGMGTAPLSSFLSISPTLLLASAENGIISSSDFGSSWRKVSTTMPEVPGILAGRNGQQGPVMIFGQGIGVQRSTDAGQTWQQADFNLGGSAVQLITSDSRGNNVYCVTGTAVFAFQPRSSVWASASSGLQGGQIASLAFDVDSAAIMYAGTSGGVFRSMNAGKSWTLLPRTFGPSDVRFFDTHKTIRTRLFAETTTGLFVSTDRGEKWNLSRPLGEIYGIRSFTFHPGNSGIIHAATREKGIIGSTDGGLTWEANRYGIEGNNILAITYEPGSDKVLYCWTENGAGFRSTNRGIVWDRYSPPWNIGSSVFISVERTEPGNVVALVDKKQVFYSMNGGATWKSVLVDELREEILSVHWNTGESALYAGTTRRGVFRLRLGPIFSNNQ